MRAKVAKHPERNDRREPSAKRARRRTMRSGHAGRILRLRGGKQRRPSAQDACALRPKYARTRCRRSIYGFLLAVHAPGIHQLLAQAHAFQSVAARVIRADVAAHPFIDHPAADEDRHGRAEAPEVKFSMGLSNISFGLPIRKVVNRVFLTLALQAGLDAAIMDPLDDSLYSELLGAELVLGRDRFCRKYTTAFRAGRIVA